MNWRSPLLPITALAALCAAPIAATVACVFGLSRDNPVCIAAEVAYQWQTLLTGMLALAAAWIAWQGVMRQISAQEELAARREEQAYSAAVGEIEALLDAIDGFWSLVTEDFAEAMRLEDRPTLQQVFRSKARPVGRLLSEARTGPIHDLLPEMDPERRSKTRKLLNAIDGLISAQSAEADKSFATGEPRKDFDWVHTSLIDLTAFDRALKGFDPALAARFAEHAKLQIHPGSVPEELKFFANHVA